MQACKWEQLDVLHMDIIYATCISVLILKQHFVGTDAVLLPRGKVQNFNNHHFFCRIEASL